ncbi:MAG: exodeoxyribonuclease VII small subunit, partial [Gammaproteobacteria bacterium]
SKGNPLATSHPPPITNIASPTILRYLFRSEKGANAVTKKSTKLPSLEESLADITQLIEKMEHGEQSLEASLTDFERGITLIKHCQKILSNAEQKVQILIQQNNQETLADYEANDDADNARDDQ